MANYNNPNAQQVFAIISPLIGEFMSRSVLKLQCSKLGITEETLGKEHLANLAEGIRKGLVTFIGSDAATKVAAKISTI